MLLLRCAAETDDRLLSPKSCKNSGSAAFPEEEEDPLHAVKRLADSRTAAAARTQRWEGNSSCSGSDRGWAMKGFGTADSPGQVQDQLSHRYIELQFHEREGGIPQ